MVTRLHEISCARLIHLKGQGNATRVPASLKAADGVTTPRQAPTLTSILCWRGCGRLPLPITSISIGADKQLGAAQRGLREHRSAFTLVLLTTKRCESQAMM